ncbi:hypothetical protein F01_530038 [Burkholderia cenocepacia]|nr:hypothetical protein F01_530038 [Burkholderia cenocepacia]
MCRAARAGVRSRRDRRGRAGRMGAELAALGRGHRRAESVDGHVDAGHQRQYDRAAPAGRHAAAWREARHAFAQRVGRPCEAGRWSERCGRRR